MTDAQDLIEIQIEDVARGGSGVGFYQEKAVFVPFTAPGDHARVRIVKSHKRHIDAELVELLVASEKREVPRCPVFTICGGCDWQHLSYALQWKTKVSGALQALARAQVAVPENITIEEYPALHPWNYRNRVQLHLQDEKLGFYKRRSHDVVEITHCPIAEPALNLKISEIRAAGTDSFGASAKIELESIGEGQVRLAINQPHAAYGFRQVNDEQNEFLRACVAYEIDAGAHVLDLFGGAGNLSRGLSDKVRAIDCVDRVTGGALSFARPPHFRFHALPVKKWLEQNKNEIPVKKLQIILDPPREGLTDTWPALKNFLERHRAEKIILVGCDPDAWAKDSQFLLNSGYALVKLGFVDLFPQTIHLESVAVFTRTNSF